MSSKYLVVLAPLLCFMGPTLHAVESSSSTVSSSTFTWRQMPNTVLPVGENLHFTIKWGLVTAGDSTLSIQGIDHINGRPAYHIVSIAKSAGVVTAFYRVEDHNEAWLDQGSLSSVRYEKKIHEGKYSIEESTLMDQPNGRYHLQSYRLDKNTYEQKEGPMPPNTLDVLSSLYYVRLMPLVVGQSQTMDVLSGDKVYPLEVLVEKREIIKVAAGKFDTFKVEPLLRAPGIFIAKGKKLEVWLTADDRHMPVRMRSEVFIGHVSAELQK